MEGACNHFSMYTQFSFTLSQLVASKCLRDEGIFYGGEGLEVRNESDYLKEEKKNEWKISCLLF